MIHTYFGTTFREVKNSIVLVDVFDRCRYNSSIKRENILESLEFDRTVTSWDIIKGGGVKKRTRLKEERISQTNTENISYFTSPTTPREHSQTAMSAWA